MGGLERSATVAAAAARRLTSTLLGPRLWLRDKGSLRTALWGLRAMSALAPLHGGLQRPPLWETAWAEDLLGLGGHELAAWYARAWWGLEASRAVSRRLHSGREDEVAALLDGSTERAFAPVDAALARGRGVLLVAAHVGPRQVPFWLAARRYPRTLLITERVQDEGQGTAGAEVAPVGELRRALVKGCAHLRAGGVLAMAADGPLGDETVTVPLLGRSIAFRRGVPALARLSGAPCFPLAARWLGTERIGLAIGPELPPVGAEAPRGDEALAFDRAWLAAYAAWLEPWLRGRGEDLRLYGGVWDRRLGWAS